MGRRDKTRYKSLHQQAYNRLTSMQAFGESKKEAVANGTDKDKIFSFSTYSTYWKHTKYFVQYVRENHPECTTLKAARHYVTEWLQKRTDHGLSAWTIQTEAKALGKLYGIAPTDKDYFTPPKRKREDIKRSRGEAKRDAHFSEKNNAELVHFNKGIGLRRSELEELRGKDLFTREQLLAEAERLRSEPSAGWTPKEIWRLEALKDVEKFNAQYFVQVRKGKGGRLRYSPIVGPYAEQIVERMKATAPEERVWKYVNSNADIHAYRADYATFIYKEYARPIDTIPYDGVNKGNGHKYQKDVYVCRKDEAGKRLDRAAMLMASKALGHNRICVVADNYIRNL